MKLALAIAMLLTAAQGTLSINGSPVPVPKGCRATDRAINCDDGGFTIAPADITSQTDEERMNSASVMVGEVTKLNETPEPTFVVDCAVQGKKTKCQLGSAGRRTDQQRFVLAAPISDGETTRVAVCVTPFDPRAKLPEVCRAVFDFKKVKP
ncbi:MAG: hypothetical protein ACO1OB_25635 [Archangium sp.]